ncbi:hypothetical protein ACU4GD_05595 [Cupriavidus basilensis]
MRRRLLLLLCLAMTVAMGLSAARLRLDPGFNKMIPLQHPYMQVFYQVRQQLLRRQYRPGQPALERRGRHLQRRLHG